MLDYAAAFLRDCNIICNVLCALFVEKLQTKKNNVISNEKRSVDLAINYCDLKISWREQLIILLYFPQEWTKLKESKFGLILCPVDRNTTSNEC